MFPWTYENTHTQDGKGEGIKWQLQNSHSDVKYNIGNIVHNVTTMYGARWILEISRGSLWKVCEWQNHSDIVVRS